MKKQDDLKSTKNILNRKWGFETVLSEESSLIARLYEKSFVRKFESTFSTKLFYYFTILPNLTIRFTLQVVCKNSAALLST